MSEKRLRRRRLSLAKKPLGREDLRMRSQETRGHSMKNCLKIAINLNKHIREKEQQRLPLSPREKKKAEKNWRCRERISKGEIKAVSFSSPRTQLWSATYPDAPARTLTSRNTKRSPVHARGRLTHKDGTIRPW